MKALVAVEHSVLVAIRNMTRTGELYNDPGPDCSTRLNSTGPNDAPSTSSTPWATM